MPRRDPPPGPAKPADDTTAIAALLRQVRRELRLNGISTRRGIALHRRIDRLESILKAKRTP